jgi:hypothetical protein
MAIAVFVEKVDNSVILSVVEHVLNQGKHCVANSVTTIPHTDHWTETSMGINGRIFLKDRNLAFLHPPSYKMGG